VTLAIACLHLNLSHLCEKGGPSEAREYMPRLGRLQAFCLRPQNLVTDRSRGLTSGSY
jgi:hypothetical protein